MLPDPGSGDSTHHSRDVVKERGESLGRNQQHDDVQARQDVYASRNGKEKSDRFSNDILSSDIEEERMGNDVDAIAKGQVPSMWDSIWLSISLVFRMLPYTLCSLPVFVVYWFPRVDETSFEMTETYWGADLANNTPIIIDHSFTKRWDWKVWIFLNGDLVFWGYLPMSFLAYCQFSKRQTMMILVPLVLHYALYDILRTFIGYQIITVAVALLAMPITILSIKLVLPRDSKIPSHAILQFSIFVLGFIFIQIVNLVPARGDYIQLAMICIVVPVIRELWLALARHSSRYLTTDYHVGSMVDKQVYVRRERTWVFFLYVQVNVATYARLLFTRIEDPTLMAVVIVSQSVIEIVMRLTTSNRDRLVRRLVRYFRHRCGGNSGNQKENRNRRNTLVVIPVSETAPNPNRTASTKFKSRFTPMEGKFGVDGRTTSTFAGEMLAAAKNEGEAEIAFKAFRAQISLGEMLSEYIGIICAPLVIYMYRNHPLAIPLDYYNLGNPFDEPVNVDSIFGWALSQFASEIVVDVVCTVVELRRGYPLAQVWFGKNTVFFMASIFFGTWFAMIILTALLNQTDAFDNCIGTDMCCCSNGNGLRSGGLRERYCERIYANVTYGYPNWICQ